MLLYYIRHGDPIYDPDSLTPLGQEQAKAVSKRLALHGIDRIYTSASERAIQTAQPLYPPCGSIPGKRRVSWYRDRSTPSVASPLRQLYGGIQTPDPLYTIQGQQVPFSSVDRWYDHPAFSNTRFREGMEFFGQQTDAFLGSLGYRRDEAVNCYQAVAPTEERVALFAHWGAGGAILSHILGIPYPQFSTHFTMGHSSVTVVEFREVDGIVIPKALTYANDSHLYREGLPTKFANRIYI